LYDLRTDVGEKNDIAGKRPEVVKRVETLFATSRTPSKDWPTG
jgi:hypothetical protein